MTAPALHPDTAATAARCLADGMSEQDTAAEVGLDLAELRLLLDLGRRGHSRPRTEVTRGLTTSRLEVLQRAAYGHPNARIAAERGVHPSTVRSYLAETRRALEADSTEDAIDRARLLGLIR